MKRLQSDPAAPTTVKPYKNTSTGFWGVNIYWAATKHRERPSLGVPIDQDPSAAFEAFKRDVLPDIIDAYRAAPPGARVREPKDASNARLRDLIDWYIDSHMPFVGNTQKSIDRYDQILRDFELYCRSSNIGRIQQLTWARIEEWQAWMQKHRAPKNNPDKPRTAQSKYDEVSVVRRMLNAAVETGKIEKSPISKWVLPKPRKGRSKYKALKLNQLREFLQLIVNEEPSIADVTLWMAYTGWGENDVLDLRWEEVDLHNRCIDRDRLKTGAGIRWPVTDDLMAILQRRLDALPGKPKPKDLVFTLPGGSQKQREQYLHKHMTRCCERFGFELRVIPRDLRKTFGTLHATGALHPDGVPTPPAVLKELMCHKDIATTMTFYVDVDASMMKQWGSVGTTAMSPDKPLKTRVMRRHSKK